MFEKREKEIEASIHGKVQGVWFRDFAKKRADELGLAGFVRNAEDGSVDVLAQGDEKALARFVTLLKNGPVFAKVENIDVTWHDTLSDSYTEFTIEP